MFLYWDGKEEWGSGFGSLGVLTFFLLPLCLLSCGICDPGYYFISFYSIY